MVTELTIRNFLLFDAFSTKGLRRINLITGKNNTGKTALLEALRLLASGADSRVANHILQQRGQSSLSFPAAYDLLFNRSNTGVLQINELEIRKSVSGHTPEPFYEVRIDGSGCMSLDNASDPAGFVTEQAVFLPFPGKPIPMKELWEKTDAAGQEDVLFLIRETIEPRLLQLDTAPDGIHARLKDEAFPIPLRTLGRGVQRVMLIALALANSKGKILLIDGFEASLHHAIQEKVWEWIFSYAQKWDIQAFITTQSKDTIRAFHSVASRPEHKEQALFLRLQRSRKGQIEAVSYPVERLENALEMGVEVR